MAPRPTAPTVRPPACRRKRAPRRAQLTTRAAHPSDYCTPHRPTASRCRAVAVWGPESAKSGRRPESARKRPWRRGRSVTSAAPKPKATPSFDSERVEAAIKELLLAIGEDPSREGLLNTPARVARAYKESFEGLQQDPEAVLTTIFDEGHDEMVLVRDITFTSFCEHH